MKNCFIVPFKKDKTLPGEGDSPLRGHFHELQTPGKIDGQHTR